MAAGHLSAPGTEYGPCIEPCEHTDCASTQRMAEQACTHCDKPIGYDRNFFRISDDDWSVLAHADCEYDAIAKSQRVRPEDAPR